MNIKNILAVAKKSAAPFLAVGLLAFSINQAVAQNSGTDLFGPVKTIVLQTPTTASTSTAVGTTNTWVDLRQFVGMASVFISAQTNIAGGTLTNVFIWSNDQTNSIAFSGFALGVSTNIPITNMYYNGSTYVTNKATNTWILPGTLTNYTAFQSGNASWALVPSAFTNSSTIVTTAAGIYELGFNIQDAPRYVEFATQTGGTITNYTLSAILIGRTSYGPPTP